ncbi:MAG: dTDP-4-dehydrorhamnose 3,5-epimerase [Magnetococcales bacterium]|nr:dTDP-4-dehydrorhamnose 3,5-epimerase [Magnetococcales bacterium]
MQVKETSLPGVLLIIPKVFPDPRGFFLETYHQSRYQEMGIDFTPIQANHSRSQSGVLRGLHFQLEHPQAKLAYVTQGKVFDVAVDVRKNSPNFGKWTGAILDDINHHQLYIPKGFAHGYCVLSNTADFTYQCSDIYHQQSESGIAWNDPNININWPINNPSLSDKDKLLLNLDKTPSNKLPSYTK